MAPRTFPMPSTLVLAALLASVLAGCSRNLPVAPRHDAAAVSTRHLAPQDDDDDEDPDEEVVVTLAEGADAQALAADYDATLVEWEADERCAKYLPPADVPRDTLVARLGADPRCVSVETNRWLETAESRQQSFAFDDGDPSRQAYDEQPAAHAVRLAQAHRVSRGRGIGLAILDTGVDASHPALAGRIALGRDFVDDDLDPSDVRDGVDQDGDGHVDEAFGHGTHVAGIAALAAPEARLIMVRVLDADGRGDILDVAAGVRWAVQHGARVLNLSLGSLEHSSVLQDALSEAENAGVVVVVSAGNWGAPLPEEFPARSSHAVAVAASDAEARPAPFTSFADFVALSAPGVGVRSAYPGGLYRLWSGTSMSAPFVAGTAALLLERHPDWDSDDVLERLRSTARPLLEVDAIRTGRLGTGMLDAGEALRADHVQAAGGDHGPSRDGLE